MKELSFDNTSFYDLPEMTGITETTDRHGLGVVDGPIAKGAPATSRIAKTTTGTVPTINPPDDSQWSARWTPPPESDQDTKMTGNGESD